MKRSYIFFVILSYILNCHEVLSQQSSISPKDSLLASLEQFDKKDTNYVKVLFRLGKLIQYREPTEAFGYYEEALTICKSLEPKAFKLMAQSTSGLGICSAIQQHYPDAIKHFKDAIKISEYLGDQGELSINHTNLGIMYRILGDYPRSIAQYREALAIDSELGDSSGIATINVNLGVLFEWMEESDKAMKHFLDAYHIRKRLGEEEKLASLNINIGSLLLDEGKYEKAKALFEEGLERYTLQNDSAGILISHLKLGMVHFELADYPKASSFLNLAKEEADRLGKDDNSINARFHLNKLYLQLDQNDLALRNSREALTIADSLNIFPLKERALQAMHQVYAAIGDYKTAYQYHIQFKAIGDSVFNETTTKAFKNQQVMMEVEAKDRTLEQQALTVDHLNQRVKSEQRWNWLLGFVSILLLAIGALFYQKYAQGRRYTSAMEVKNHQIATQKEEIAEINLELEKQMDLRIEADNTINYFAASLFGKNTIDDILWDVAQNCMSRLGLEDCVIYLLDEKREVLVQKAAYGGKNPTAFHIESPIEIPIGKGIVGAVAQSGHAELIKDTSIDPRYIVDDANRLSELAVPLIIKGKVIGIIDSEHPDKHFFTQHHVDTLKTIASICSSKIAQIWADEEARKGKLAQLEADRMRELDQLKSRFFANISHEFRTPLTLILGPTEQLLHQLTDERQQQQLNWIHQNGLKLQQLINQLLDLSKIEAGKLPLAFSQKDVVKFSKYIGSAFESLAQQKELSLIFPTRNEPLFLYMDPNRFEQILINILNNAFKFTSEGYVSLQVEEVVKEEKEYAQIIVADSGMGIHPDQLPYIFERFFQADQDDQIAYEGTGIGLSLCKELVELHSGKIEVVSELGKGTSFIISLPLGRTHLNEKDIVNTGDYTPLRPMPLPEKTTPSIHPTPEVQSEDQTLPMVLIIDDNSDMLDYIQFQLKEQFQLLRATNGADGLELAQKELPDLIISDVMMPGMNGLELCRRIKQDIRTDHIPIMLLTARMGDDHKIEGLRSKADAYLQKPFNRTELSVRVQNLIQNRKLLKKRFAESLVFQASDIAENPQEALFLQGLVDAVEDHLSDTSFDVNQLCQIIGMSKSQLNRKMKAVVNKSPNQFIRSYRLQKAKQMIVRTELSVSEIAYEVGFSSPAYFTKCFHDEFGYPPSHLSSSHGGS